MFIIRCLILVLITSLSTLSVAASYVTVPVTASASGMSEDKAIAKALGQAVQQANGTLIKVESHIRDTDQGIVMDWMGNQTLIPSQEVNTGYTSSTAGGLVKSYTVLSSKYNAAAKAWEVTIKAEVAKYASIGADRSGLLQLAVLPFRTTDPSFASVEGSMAAAELAQRINELMTNAIVQSGKYRVLDRSFWQESNIEEVIVQERSYATQESIKLGQKLGADYMVVGNINDFDIRRVEKKMYGATSSVFETQIAIQLRVIEVATSDIIASTNYTQTFDPRQLTTQRNVLRAAGPEKTETQLDIELQNYIYETVSNSMVEDISSRISGGPGVKPATGSPSSATPKEARPLTPGSSEAPISWPQ
jgi:curli biogenesis system outer membrane secretion channel CsgG